MGTRVLGADIDHTDAAEPLADAAGKNPYSEIRHAILNGEFAPDDVLLETKLTSRLAVSRTPIREALGRLAQEGLLERLSRGFRVRRSSPEELLDIYEARITLESEIAALAAERHTPMDAALLKALERRISGLTDVEELHQVSGTWHVTIRAAGHNGTISELLTILDTRIQLYSVHQQTNEREIVSVTLKEHAAIVRAVLGRDRTAAHDLMRDHLSRIRDVRVAVLLQRQDTSARP
ncbi:GntR family transcriptional regulator [Actinacidiphila alni]|uniref:GntR family transcriptional regulator n=1 Tax=Actinacidiphila alni TaxID=380248 RepID=UPI00345216FE